MTITYPSDLRLFRAAENAIPKQDSFAVYGIVDFTPRYVPTRFSIVKSRNLDRDENFCGGEDVSDIGSQNREIHVAGTVRSRELQSFNDLLDLGEPVELVIPGWVGEVNVEDGDLEGPTQIEPNTHDELYQYSLNFVSTGENESEYEYSI
jgi:hypothetical protein